MSDGPTTNLVNSDPTSSCTLNKPKERNPSKLKDIYNCKICNITVDSSIKIYNWSNTVYLCQSCRKVYYNIWREILTDNYCTLVAVKSNLNRIVDIVYHYLNTSVHLSCKKQFLFSDFASFCEIEVQDEVIQRRSEQLLQDKHIRKRKLKYNKTCKICRFKRMIFLLSAIPKLKLKLNSRKLLSVKEQHKDVGYIDCEIELNQLYNSNKEFFSRLAKRFKYPNGCGLNDKNENTLIGALTNLGQQVSVGQISSLTEGISLQNSNSLTTNSVSLIPAVNQTAHLINYNTGTGILIGQNDDQIGIGTAQINTQHLSQNSIQTLETLSSGQFGRNLSNLGRFADSSAQTLDHQNRSSASKRSYSQFASHLVNSNNNNRHSIKYNRIGDPFDNQNNKFEIIDSPKTAFSLPYGGETNDLCTLSKFNLTNSNNLITECRSANNSSPGPQMHLSMNLGNIGHYKSPYSESYTLQKLYSIFSSYKHDLDEAGKRLTTYDLAIELIPLFDNTSNSFKTTKFGFIEINWGEKTTLSSIQSKDDNEIVNMEDLLGGSSKNSVLMTKQQSTIKRENIIMDDVDYDLNEAMLLNRRNLDENIHSGSANESSCELVIDEDDTTNTGNRIKEEMRNHAPPIINRQHFTSNGQNFGKIEEIVDVSHWSEVLVEFSFSRTKFLIFLKLNKSLKPPLLSHHTFRKSKTQEKIES